MRGEVARPSFPPFFFFFPALAIRKDAPRPSSSLFFEGIFSQSALPLSLFFSPPARLYGLPAQIRPPLSPPPFSHFPPPFQECGENNVNTDVAFYKRSFFPPPPLSPFFFPRWEGSNADTLPSFFPPSPFFSLFSLEDGGKEEGKCGCLPSPPPSFFLSENALFFSFFPPQKAGMADLEAFFSFFSLSARLAAFFFSLSSEMRRDHSVAASCSFLPLFFFLPSGRVQADSRPARRAFFFFFPFTAARENSSGCLPFFPSLRRNDLASAADQARAASLLFPFFLRDFELRRLTSEAELFFFPLPLPPPFFPPFDKRGKE